MLILEMVYDIVLPPLIVNVLEKSPIVFMVEDWSVRIHHNVDGGLKKKKHQSMMVLPNL